MEENMYMLTSLIFCYMAHIQRFPMTLQTLIFVYFSGPAPYLLLFLKIRCCSVNFHDPDHGTCGLVSYPQWTRKKCSSRWEHGRLCDGTMACVPESRAIFVRSRLLVWVSPCIFIQAGSGADTPSAGKSRCMCLLADQNEIAIAIVWGLLQTRVYLRVRE